MNFRKVVPNLQRDESIFVFTRPHPLSFAPWIGICLLLFILGIGFMFSAYFLFPDIRTGLGYNIFIVLSSAFLLMILPFMAVAFIDYYYDVHTVTDRRLVDIDQHSLFVREINELALEEVQDVTYKNVGILGSVFDFGSVYIETSSAEQKFEFDNVHYPGRIAAIILDLADQAKMRIERGNVEPVVVRCDMKGVIEGKGYYDVKELIKLGAIVPLDVPHYAGSLETPEGTHARSASELSIAGIPAKREADIAPIQEPGPQHHAPESSVNEPKQDEKMAKLRSEETEDLDGDLDIVIDDPGNGKSTKG